MDISTGEGGSLDYGMAIREAGADAQLIERLYQAFSETVRMTAAERRWITRDARGRLVRLAAQGWRSDPLSACRLLRRAAALKAL